MWLQCCYSTCQILLYQVHTLLCTLWPRSVQCVQMGQAAAAADQVNGLAGQASTRLGDLTNLRHTIGDQESMCRPILHTDLSSSHQTLCRLSTTRQLKACTYLSARTDHSPKVAPVDKEDRQPGGDPEVTLLHQHPTADGCVATNCADTGQPAE